MIISDPHFAVNISPFTIYLIDRHGELNPEFVERLNYDSELAGRVYRFKLIECTPGRLDKTISSNLSGYLEQCNILLRLFPTPNHQYSYLTDIIRFEYSYDFFRFKIMDFLSSNTYPQNYYTEEYWNNTRGNCRYRYFIKFLNFHSSCLEDSMDKFLIKRTFYNDFFMEGSSKRDCYLKIMGRFNTYATKESFNLPDDMDSDKLFFDIINGKEKPLTLDETSLNEEKPKEVSIEIHKTYHYNTYDYKPKYLFACNFDRVVVPVYIGRPIAAIIYLYVLLFAKAGKRFNRENLKWYYDNGEWPDYMNCLEDAYNIFFNNQAAKKFKTWLKEDVNKIGDFNDKWRNLNQAKGSIGMLIEKQIIKYDDRLLEDMSQLKVLTYTKKFQTTYGISLTEDKIIVPEEFMPIVEKIKEFDFDRVFGD